MTRRFTQAQRETIHRACHEWPAFKAAHPTFDVVDYASESGNYFWSELTDRQTRWVLRLMGYAQSA